MKPCLHIIKGHNVGIFGDIGCFSTYHALPALIAKMCKAKNDGLPNVIVFGTGNARREWLYIDDLANASLFLMNNYENNVPINIGYGDDISMLSLSVMIKNIVEYDGELIFNSSCPDGMPRKLLNTTKLKQLGWKSCAALMDGIRNSIDYFVQISDVKV